MYDIGIKFDMIWYELYKMIELITFKGKYRNNASVECKKVVSAFSSFLQEMQFRAQISFLFHCFFTSYLFHKNENTLSRDLR